MGVAVGGASILLLYVEVTQADRQARVVCLTPQRRGADCGEGTWAKTVGGNNLTVCKGKAEEKDRERKRENSS